jgi:hypothetical protein
MDQREGFKSQSGLTFFGLTSTYRITLFSQIHEILFHGKGGYDYATVYHMPIWLRRYTFQKLQEHYQKEAEEYEKAKQKSKGSQTPTRVPNKTPTYSTKARK